MALSRVSASGEVLVDVDDARDWLTVAERQRIGRLRDPGDRDDAVAAHVLVRLVAAEHLGSDPRSLTILQRCADCGGPHGQPQVIEAPGLGVSLAHTRGWVAAAAHDGSCGVDVERLDLLRGRRLPRGVLTAAESAWVDQADDQITAFGALWVRKEALVKAGVVSLDDARSVCLVTDGRLTDHHAGFTLTSLSEGPVTAATAFRSRWE